MKKEVKTPSILKRNMKGKNSSEEKHKFPWVYKKYFQEKKKRNKKQEKNVIFLLQKGK